jgi:hypothetical protein
MTGPLDRKQLTPCVAFYFGRIDCGHYLYNSDMRTVRREVAAGIPWNVGLMDAGLLKNGKHCDVIDGRVFWTCARGLWFAFYWWDRSGDSRQNSNSGFYVQGFEFAQKAEAFAFACEMFPQVVARQDVPLVVVD